MKFTRKLLFGIGIGIVFLVLLGLSGIGQHVYTSTNVDYPNSWLEIEPGMASDEARQLLGEPHADGRGLKSLDRRQQTNKGVEMHLDLWFEGESHESAIVKRVVRWKHFLGMDVEKHTEPPWN